MWKGSQALRAWNAKAEMATRLCHGKRHISAGWVICMHQVVKYQTPCPWKEERGLEGSAENLWCKGEGRGRRVGSLTFHYTRLIESSKPFTRATALLFIATITPESTAGNSLNQLPQRAAVQWLPESECVVIIQLGSLKLLSWKHKTLTPAKERVILL